jgi:hypothetical protein
VKGREDVAHSAFNYNDKNDKAKNNVDTIC